MEGNVKERLKEYLEYKQVSARKFTQSIGVSETYVQSISKSIQPDKLYRISEEWPDLNLLWLLLGIGNMLNGDEDMKKAKSAPENDVPLPAIIDGDAWEVIKQQAASLASKDRQVEALIDLLKKTDVRMGGTAGCADVG